ncbi:MAG: hypothetical protein J5505_00970, partial [Spirochaetaceae bacterium]|nr:hypothetical protein [Spirochaetaceae bacterium]
MRSCASAALAAFALVFAHGLLILATNGELALYKPETLLLFLCSALCFGVISFLLPKTPANIVTAVLLILIVLAECIQICFFGVFATFSTLGVILNGTEALTNFPQIVAGTIYKNRYFLLLSLLPLFFALIPFFIDADHTKRRKKLLKEKLLKLKKAKKSQIRQIKNLIKEEKLSFKHIAICAGLLVMFKLFLTVFICGTFPDNGSLYSVLTEKKPVDATVLTTGAFHAYALDCERMLLQDKRT